MQNPNQKLREIGPGFYNFGNTCFLNSVLQCMSYTTLFVNKIRSHQHSSKCRMNQFCILCEFENFYISCQGQSLAKPTKIVQNIRNLSKRFKPGRQEDAHEFYLALIDNFQKACIGNSDKIKQLKLYEQMTQKTIIFDTFSGQQKSQIKCLKCNYKSETFETFYELQLDINNVSTLQQSLDLYFQREDLRGDNKYYCCKCNQKVNATKQYLLHRCPNVLTIQFKRFNNQLRKLNKIISFQLNFTTQRYSDEQTPTVYDLYAVLIHQGSSIFSGHYYCYIKNSSNSWYQMNDQLVQKVSSQRVIDENPYMLFYAKRQDQFQKVNKKQNDKFLSVNQNNLNDLQLINQIPKNNQDHIIKDQVQTKTQTDIENKQKQKITNYKTNNNGDRTQIIEDDINKSFNQYNDKKQQQNNINLDDSDDSDDSDFIVSNQKLQNTPSFKQFFSNKLYQQDEQFNHKKKKLSYGEKLQESLNFDQPLIPLSLKKSVSVDCGKSNDKLDFISLKRSNSVEIKPKIKFDFNKFQKISKTQKRSRIKQLMYLNSLFKKKKKVKTGNPSIFKPNNDILQYKNIQELIKKDKKKLDKITQKLNEKQSKKKF